MFPIVSKKEKKKEVCDDYLTEWRGFLKTYPTSTLDGWSSGLYRCRQLTGLDLLERKRRDYPETEPQDIRSDLPYPVGMLPENRFLLRMISNESKINAKRKKAVIPAAFA